VGLIGLIGLLVARFIPVARLPFWGCAFREITGWPCPGCGLTRVADRISHLNFAGAWDANPLGTIAALGFLATIALSTLHLAFRLPAPSVRLTPVETRAGCVLVALAVVLNWSWLAMKARFPELLAGG
jgi:hypothetical protein